MPRRIIPWLLVPLLVLAVTPAQAMRGSAAHTKVIAQKSVKKGGTITLYGTLKSGHAYRIEVVSTGKFAVAGEGFQQYNYLSGKHPIQGMKGFTLKGTTPYGMSVRAPVKASLTQWILAATISVTGRHPLTVRYRDLGPAK